MICKEKKEILAVCSCERCSVWGWQQFPFCFWLWWVCRLIFLSSICPIQCWGRGSCIVSNGLQQHGRAGTQLSGSAGEPERRGGEIPHLLVDNHHCHRHHRDFDDYDSRSIKVFRYILKLAPSFHSGGLIRVEVRGLTEGETLFWKKIFRWKDLRWATLKEESAREGDSGLKTGQTNLDKCKITRQRWM